MPIAFDLTGGEKANTSKFETLIAVGPNVTPRAVVADKGYERKANQAAARKQRVIPVIPYRSTTTNIPEVFGKALYRARARIEQVIGKLKRFKRIAMLCEKTKQNFRSFVSAFILVKSVYTA